MKDAAVILYGRGGSLGNFEIFARDIKKRLTSGRAASPSGTFAAADIFSENIERRTNFFSYLNDPPFKATHKIKELHILSHSIGAGLFISYGDPAVQTIRANAITAAGALGRNVSYIETLNAEIGAILVDDFARAPYDAMKTQIRTRFASGAFVKIWGCNSAIDGWVYSDNGITDQTDTSVVYYWRAFNTMNVPKASVAKAFAKYFDLTTYGASSGSHIEVLHRGHWVSSGDYRRLEGSWPSGTREHRLAPDRGSFDAYAP